MLPRFPFPLRPGRLALEAISIPLLHSSVCRGSLMRRLFVAALVLIFASAAFSQAKHPFTFEDMMKLKRVGEPEVSPDGKWVIFSVVDVSLEANTKTPHIWIAPLSRTEAARSEEKRGMPHARPAQ